MKIKIFNKNEKWGKNRRRKIIITPLMIGIIVFIITFFTINFYSQKTLVSEKTNYIENLNVTLPIIYQERNKKKLNELRGYTNREYDITANATLTMLEEERKLNLLIIDNGSTYTNFEYEVRDKTSNSLIERTKLDITKTNEEKEKGEKRITLNIQNIIKQNKTYLLTIKLDIEGRQIYYFANIIYKQNINLDEAINTVEDFTIKTFDAVKAATLVKYLETSINRDTKEMYSVTLQQTFEQLTFANTGMKLVSELYYNIYQSQEYSFNIVVNFLSKSGNNKKNEYFINRDEYVLRWDEARWYYMKFNRMTEEILNIDDNPYNKKNHRFYFGVTNPNDFYKIESENKRFFAFSKAKEIYIYDTELERMTSVFSYNVRDKKNFEKVTNNYNVKIMKIDDDGSITYIIYGYNMSGANEGYMGIGIYKYNAEENISEEKLFIPIYTTYQSLKYDIEKLCVFKNNRLIFKSYNKVYSIDIDTAEILTLAEGFEETKFAASGNNRYFAFNDDIEFGKSKRINIYNIDDGKVTNIDAEENENIEVVTFMNDDLFYGVFSDENVWREAGKVIGRPSHEIRVINTITGKRDLFKEENRYLYNFVNENAVLRYNRYRREGTHYFYLSNDVIVNNYSNENNDIFNYKEELTKEKLRVGYIEIDLKDRDMRYQKNGGIIGKQIEDTALESTKNKEENIYYVYDSGRLLAKLKNLSDGIKEIRDNYGYVKLNDQITCYNRANKGNVSYLRQNDSILENLKDFEENVYLKNYDTLVMNVTGVTERDLEYFISLKEKIAVYKNDLFQFFITGYDNNNYVLEYQNKERILTPRNEVREAVIYGGYVLFAQLENLE